MICRRCKSEMPEGLRYCGNCGRRMNVVEFLLFTRRGRPIFIGILAALLLVAAVVTGVLVLGGREEEKVSPEQLQAVLEQTFAEIQEGEAPAYLLAMEERAGFEVLSATQEEDQEEPIQASAQVRIWAPDLYSVILEMNGLMFQSVEEMDAAMTGGVRNAGLREAEVTVVFTRIDGSWEPNLTDTFMDAYYGGLLTYRDEFYAELEEGSLG